jgi:hypothetical protein
MLPESLEYVCWTHLFEVGKLRLDVRKELEDIIAVRDENPQSLMNQADKTTLAKAFEVILGKAKNLVRAVLCCCCLCTSHHTTSHHITCTSRFHACV